MKPFHDFMCIIGIHWSSINSTIMKSHEIIIMHQWITIWYIIWMYLEMGWRWLKSCFHPDSIFPCNRNPATSCDQAAEMHKALPPMNSEAWVSRPADASATGGVIGIPLICWWDAVGNQWRWCKCYKKPNVTLCHTSWYQTNSNAAITSKHFSPKSLHVGMAL